MSVLDLQTLEPRVADNGVLGNSCSSSTSRCCDS
jgi:hypothetical protein